MGIKISSSSGVEVDTNSYYKLLNDVSKDTLFDGLLGYGLFAEKIPPFLTAEYFLGFCKDKNNIGILEHFSKPHKYINYQNIRNTNIPRILGIPNPFAYYYQCKILSNNWDKLLEYFKEKTQEQKHKISRIHIRKLKNKKHLFEMNYKNFEVDDYPEPNLLIGKKYLVKADISNCFPSIYTHAIAWALAEKSKAKKNKKDSKWFNQIDKATRNLKDSETHGILIGCHSSNLISEIILTAIDKEMYDKNYSYIRNIDDYDCYVETMEKAEQFLIDLSMELRKYDLTLNLKKTKILSLPTASTEHWVRRLNLFLFHNQYPKDDTEKNNEIDFCTTRAYLDTALDLMTQNNENSAILKYAIKVIAKKKLTLRATEYFINTIHHLVLIYPYLIGMIDEYVFSIFKLPQNIIKAIATNIFEFGKEKNAFEAMSYALYFALKYNFKIRDNLFEIVEKTHDAVLLLLAFLHDKKFIGNSALKNYQDLAQSFIDNIDEYWVFVYEVLDEKELGDNWKRIKEKGISFIKKDFLDDAISSSLPRRRIRRRKI